MPPKRAFVALQDRFVSSLAVVCCPAMDLVAVLTLDHHLLVHRTTSWQKLLHVKPSDIGFEMMALAWKPDGLQLAVGCDKGDVAIFEIESGEILPERRSSFRHENCITALHWAQINVTKATGSSSNNKRHRRHIPRGSGDAWNAPGFSSQSKLQFRRRSSRFLKGFTEVVDGDETLLLTADEQGFIILWWMGRVPLTRIDVSKHFTEDEFEVLESMGWQRGDSSGFLIERMDIVPDLSLLFVLLVFSSKSTQNADHTMEDQSETKVHRLLALDMTAIQYIHDEVALVASTVDRVHAILDRITIAGRQMTTEWKNATRIFELKMGLIGSLYEKYACEDPPQVDMLSVIVTGITAPALAQYFAQDIQEMSVLRMQKALFSGCNSLRTLVDEKLKPDLVGLLFLVSELRGHAKWNPEIYAKTMGITVDALDDFVQRTQDTLVEMETLTLALHETRQDFALFFEWIHERIRIHSSSSQSGGGTRTSARDAAGAAHGTKSLLNLRRLCDFLQRAAESAKHFRKQQPSHSVYKVETTFGNPVSHQLSMPYSLNDGSGNQSVGCVLFVKRLQEMWSVIIDAIGSTLAQSVVCEKSGCFTVGSSSSSIVQECHVRFRQPFSTMALDDITEDDDQNEHQENADEAVDWNALNHYGPMENGVDDCHTILIGYRLQSGILLLLRAVQERDDLPSRLTWEAAAVSFSQGSSSNPLICQGFDFYGDTLTNKNERLAVVLARTGEDQVQQVWLYLQQYDNIKFSRCNTATSFEEILSREPSHTFKLDQLRGRMVALLSNAANGIKSATSVIATASRGVLCVILPHSRLTIFDAEDSEDDDDDGDEEEGDGGDEDN